MSSNDAPIKIVLALALVSGADTRTAKKALRRGVEGIKGEALRDRLVLGAEEIGVSLPFVALPNDGEEP